MKSPAPYLVVLLAATTIAGGVLAWRQYNELVELRASALDRGERAGWQKRVWELEKLNRTLQERITAARPGAPPDRLSPGSTDDTGAMRRPPERGGRGEGSLQQAAAMRELLARPEVQAMINLQQKAGIEARYAPLFKLLNLSADQAEKLTALLAERNSTRQDIITAAQEQGINPRSNPEAFRKLLTDAQNELNRGIQSVIGESGLAQLQNFEQTVPQRALVGELQQRLSYTSSPLTPAQSEQLVQVLAKNSPARPANSDSPPAGPPPPGFMAGRMVAMDFLGGGGPPPGTPTLPGVIDSAVRVGGAPISNAALGEAQGVLSPPQLATLQQMQQQQQAQQQLQQMVRETFVPPGARTPPASESAPAQTAPKQRRPGG